VVEAAAGGVALEGEHAGGGDAGDDGGEGGDVADAAAAHSGAEGTHAAVDRGGDTEQLDAWGGPEEAQRVEEAEAAQGGDDEGEADQPVGAEEGELLRREEEAERELHAEEDPDQIADTTQEG